MNALPSEVLRRHRDDILALAARPGASNVRVFGSVSRSEDRASSDIDLLVRFAPGSSIFDHAQLAEELEQLLGVRVDVVSEGDLTEQHATLAREARPL